MHSTRARWLELLAFQATRWAGSPWAFVTAVGLTLLWLASGLPLHYSESWQLTMNTVSSVATFLMVFLIQRSQNKDALAMQIKLNEIIAALHGANNRMISIENLGEAEIKELHRRYQALAERLQREDAPSTGALSAAEELLDGKPAA